MNPSRIVPSALIVISLLAAALLSGCGGSSESASASSALEKHVEAAEQFGVTLADIRTRADLDRARPELLRQARALVETVEAMDKAVIDNARLTDAEKAAAIAPYQMRLAGAERLWREELQRVAGTVGGDVLNEVREIISTAR